MAGVVAANEEFVACITPSGTKVLSLAGQPGYGCRRDVSSGGVDRVQRGAAQPVEVAVDPSEVTGINVRRTAALGQRDQACRVVGDLDAEQCAVGHSGDEVTRVVHVTGVEGV